jgi:hypothetical protein
VREASKSSGDRSLATKPLLPSRNSRRSSSTTFILLCMFYRNLFRLRNMRFPRRPTTSQSRHAPSPWMSPSSSGRGGRSGCILHSPPAATRGSCAPAQRRADSGYLSYNCDWDEWTARTRKATAYSYRKLTISNCFACRAGKAARPHRRKHRPRAPGVVARRACHTPSEAYEARLLVRMTPLTKLAYFDARVDDDENNDAIITYLSLVTPV